VRRSGVSAAARRRRPQTQQARLCESLLAPELVVALLLRLIQQLAHAAHARRSASGTKRERQPERKTTHRLPRVLRAGSRAAPPASAMASLVVKHSGELAGAAACALSGGATGRGDLASLACDKAEKAHRARNSLLTSSWPQLGTALHTLKRRVVDSWSAGRRIFIAAEAWRASLRQ
jgi:hypothetical protein